MRICMVSREDIYPPVHGAAVKIVRTAESLSRLGAEVTVVTADRLQYFRYREGVRETLTYPSWLVRMTRVPAAMQVVLDRLKLPDYWRSVERA